MRGVRLVDVGIRVGIGAAVVAAATVASAQAPRQSPPTAPAREVPLAHATDVAARQVSVRVGVDRISASARGPVTLLVDVTPRPGMHVYAPNQREYESVKLDVAPARWYTAGKVVYPPGAELFLRAVNQRVQVYDTRFRVAAPLTLGAAATWPATSTVSGALTYQACDATVCYRPESVKLTWTIGLAR